MNDKNRFYLLMALGLIFYVYLSAINVNFINKPIYTIEVYEIFEVVLKSNNRTTLTCVYTYGQGQFFFRGDIEINASKAYTFVYQENTKRWRDLTLLDYWEINVLEREEDCPTCP